MSDWVRVVFLVKSRRINRFSTLESAHRVSRKGFCENPSLHTETVCINNCVKNSVARVNQRKFDARKVRTRIFSGTFRAERHLGLSVSEIILNMS